MLCCVHAILSLRSRPQPLDPAVDNGRSPKECSVSSQCQHRRYGLSLPAEGQCPPAEMAAAVVLKLLQIFPKRPVRTALHRLHGQTHPGFQRQQPEAGHRLGGKPAGRFGADIVQNRQYSASLFVYTAVDQAACTVGIVVQPAGDAADSLHTLEQLIKKQKVLTA